jgi:AcrR family transcriptional regulator
MAARSKRPPGSSVIEALGVQRRAPFGENPSVGARGTRTQQRILHAALQVFGEDGYHACRVERITAAAGCSRPSFYQYFSSKEDLFRQLAGEVARSLFAITEDMGLVTPDEDGWEALRKWLSEYADLYERYWPVFATFNAAAGSDAVVASGAARVGARNSRALTTHIDPEAFRTESPQVVTGILVNAVNRANRYRQLLEVIAPDRAPDRERLLDSLTELLHRALFGRRGGGFVEYRPAAPRAARVRRNGRPAPEPVPGSQRLGAAGRLTRAKLLDAGSAVFAAKGYHETRVDDIVAAAGTSHGTFYRYFENKDQVFRVIAGRSGRRVFSALGKLAEVEGDPTSAAFTRRLRKWLTSYADTYAEEGPIFRVWVEALAGDLELSAATAQAMDSIRAGLAGFLEPRGFGDVDMDAFILLAILDLTSYDHAGIGPTDPAALDIALAVIRRGFLGVDARLS